LWKLADIPGSDAFPGQEVEQSSRNLQRLDDLGTKDWNPTTTYKFLFIDGQFHLSATEDFEQLAKNAGASMNEKGPMALGTMRTDMGKADFQVQTNLHGGGIVKILEDVAHKYGFSIGHITDLSGNPIGKQRKVQSMYFANQDKLLMSRNKSKLPVIDGAIHIEHNRAHVYANKLDDFQAFSEAIFEWAQDNKLTLYAGFDNDIKRIEDIDMWNFYSPEWNDIEDHFMATPTDSNDKVPQGPQRCSDCGKYFKTFTELLDHRRNDEESWQENVEDSGFPELDYDDLGQQRRYHEYFFPFQASVSAPKLDKAIPFVYDPENDELIAEPNETVDSLGARFFSPVVRGRYEPGGKIIIEEPPYKPDIAHILQLWAYSPGTSQYPIKSVFLDDNSDDKAILLEKKDKG
jgi:hypothetical protein